MESAPSPPPPGSRMQDFGDRLIVRFRPRRSVGFLSFWLAIWTLVGVGIAQKVLSGDWDGEAFYALWLCGWALGECLVGATLAWMLFGRTILVVKPEQFEVTWELGPFTRTKKHNPALVHDVIAARVPNDEDESPRNDFCLAVSYDGETVRVGEGMGEREAEYVAAAVLSRIDPHRRLRARDRAQRVETKDPEGESRSWSPGALVLLAIVVAAIGMAKVVGFDSPPEEGPVGSGKRDPLGGPVPEDFTDPRAYAAAVTVSSLNGTGGTVVGMPDCNEDATWTAWECTAVVRPPKGYLDPPVTYRCAPAYRREPGGGPAVLGVACEPKERRPLPAPDP